MDDFDDILIRYPIYYDSQQEVAMLIEQVERLDDISLLDEMTEIDKEIFDNTLKDILFEYNKFVVHDDYCNYILEDHKRDYLENLYILFYTEINLHELEGGNFIYEPRD